jgi:hypothetical protein
MLPEVGAAIASACIVSPFMTVIDASIIRSQFKKQPLQKTVQELFTKNMSWNHALRIMVQTYGATYLTANGIKKLCKEYEIDYKVPTVVCTSFVNIMAIGYKDKEYARLFATSQTPKAFPRMSYGLFAVRDAITIASSFVISHDVSRFLETSAKLSHNTAELISLLSVPMLAQVVSTPIHIAALDIYDRPFQPLMVRLRHVAQCYWPVCCGRMLRILPAFGLGGYVNNTLVTSLKANLS